MFSSKSYIDSLAQDCGNSVAKMHWSYQSLAPDHQYNSFWKLQNLLHQASENF